MDRPFITTVQELAAAVQGIEALGRGEVGVRSLQELDRAPCARRASGEAAGERRAACRSRGQVLSTAAGRRLPRT